MIDKVSGWRIGADLHEYLIAILTALSIGWTPPSVLTEDDYKDIRDNKENYPPELVGFVGFACSYAAKWFGGYCRGFTQKGLPRDYIKEAWRNVEKQKPLLKGILFRHSSYLDLVIPPNSIIYCDPPYNNATKYKDGFDHQVFWQWCRDMVDIGHQVFISEYEAPFDFEVIWQKTVNSSLTSNTGEKRNTEKLFIWKGFINTI